MTDEQSEEFVRAFKEVKEVELSLPKIMKHGSMMMKEDYLERERKEPGKYVKWDQIPKRLFQYDAFVKIEGNIQRLIDSHIDPRMLRNFLVEEW